MPCSDQCLPLTWEEGVPLKVILVHAYTLAAWFGGPHRMHCFSAGRRLPRCTPLTQERLRALIGSHETCSFWPKGLFPLAGWAGGSTWRGLWRAPREGGRRLRGKQQAGKGRPGSCGLSGAPARAGFSGLYNQLSRQRFPASGSASTDGTLNSDFFINI